MQTDLLTTLQVAALLRCSDSTVRRQAARLGVGVKLGRDRFYTREDVDRLRSAVRPHAGNPLFGTVYVGKKMQSKEKSEKSD